MRFRLSSAPAIHPALLALLFLGAAACSDSPTGPEVPVDPFDGLTPGLYPSLYALPAVGGIQEVGVALKGVGNVPDVSALQLTLQIDTSRVKVLGAEVRDGLVGAWNQDSSGGLHLAVVALEQLDDQPLLTLSLMVTEPLSADFFVLRGVEATDASDFSDASSSLTSAAHPILVSFP